MGLNQSKDIKELKKFDIDLEFGQAWEQYIDDIFKGAKTCEVKTERDTWATTGNICIELESYGKPSGINATESELWVHNLTKDGKHIASIVIPTDVLKDVIETIPSRTVMGGDNRASKIQLIALTKLVNTLKEL